MNQIPTRAEDILNKLKDPSGGNQRAGAFYARPDAVKGRMIHNVDDLMKIAHQVFSDNATDEANNAVSDGHRCHSHAWEIRAGHLLGSVTAEHFRGMVQRMIDGYRKDVELTQFSAHWRFVAAEVIQVTKLHRVPADRPTSAESAMVEVPSDKDGTSDISNNSVKYGVDYFRFVGVWVDIKNASPVRYKGGRPQMSTDDMPSNLAEMFSRLEAQGGAAQAAKENDELRAQMAQQSELMAALAAKVEALTAPPVPTPAKKGK